MDYSVSYRRNSMALDEFRDRYQQREKYIAFCRECPKYEIVWSCPPLGFAVDTYLNEFGWITVVGAKIDLSREVIARADTAAKIRALGWGIVSTVKRDMESRMIELEGVVPRSRALSSGGCDLCKECSRRQGRICRQLDKMRYSLDAFGFDLSAITRDMLGIEIQWCRDRLPDYFTLIHGLLTGEPVSEQVWAANWQDLAINHNGNLGR